MIALASLCVGVGGLASIALSMERHARQAGFKTRQPRRYGIGWLLIALSLLAEAFAPQWRVALVEWIGVIGASAAVVVLVLIYRPLALPKVAIAAPAIGALIWIALFVTQ